MYCSMFLGKPALGEVWQDMLGGRYRVVEVDDEAYCVKLEVVRSVPELVMHARRWMAMAMWISDVEAGLVRDEQGQTTRIPTRSWRAR